jgi:rRNA maturation endonuclease Nob1
MTTSSIDSILRFELDALRARAAHVIDEHTNHHGSCHACGRRFPCQEACLAEHNLAICGFEQRAAT